ncbi:MAG: PP0621 family protein [Gammaproteobacteria bacterium]
MFGIRILLMLIGVGLVIAILVHFARGSRQITEKKPKHVDKVVECQHCGTYIPEQEAIEFNGSFYCCEQHRRDAQHKKSG